jgi:hypothetical protein
VKIAQVFLRGRPDLIETGRYDFDSEGTEFINFVRGSAIVASFKKEEIAAIVVVVQDETKP